MSAVLVAALVFALLQPPPPPPPPGTPAMQSQLPPRPSPSDSAVIRGRIVRTDGRPLPRAQVRIELADVARRGGWPATTDDDGRYEVMNLPAGRYTVTATKIGYWGFAFGQLRVAERGESIVLAAGEVRERVDITLPKSSAVAGRIVDEYGDPIEGAIVRVLQIRFVRGRRQLGELPGVFSRRTNDLGQFRVFGVQPGRYLVSATVGEVTPRSAADLPGYAVTYFPGTPNPVEAQFVTVGLSQDALNVDFALSRTQTASIRGTATNSAGEPITGGISLAPAHRSGAISSDTVGARITPDGRFEFPNLAPGEYVIQAQKNSQPFIEGEFASQLVTVNGADVTGVDLRTSPGSQIAGRLSFEGGDPPRANSIELSPVPSDFDLAPRGGLASAKIHDDWTFEVAGISGPRRLRLTRVPRGWSLKAILLNGTDITDTPLTFGTKDQSIRDVEVVLTNRVTSVFGTVSDSRGRAAPASHVIVFARDRGLWYPASRFLAHTTAGTSGAFGVLALPPGEYWLAAVDRMQGNDFGGEWQDPALLETLAVKAVSVTLAEGQQMQLAVRLSAR